jgi:stage IV sporulation protein A
LLNVHILELVLSEFPVNEVRIKMPAWVSALDSDNRIKVSVRESVNTCAATVTKTGDIKEAFSTLSDNEYIKTSVIEDIDLGTGKAVVSINFDDALYYSVLSELGGFEIKDDRELVALLRELS